MKKERKKQVKWKGSFGIKGVGKEKTRRELNFESGVGKAIRGVRTDEPKTRSAFIYRSSFIMLVIMQNLKMYA